jgi:hypothetical protein
MKDFLFTSQGREYLLDHYVEQEKSIYVVAQERSTYPNHVRRALLHHRIRLRDRSEAQRAALKHGRNRHPTAGRSRTDEEKTNIGQSLLQSWKGRQQGDEANE